MLTQMTSSDTLWLAEIKRFAQDRIAPAAQFWGTKQPDPELFAEAASLGLMRLSVPKSAGGLEKPLSLKACAFATLAEADFGFAMAVVNSHNVAVRLAVSASSSVHRSVLPALLDGQTLGCTALTEPSAGSDLGGLETVASREPGGWRINGTKIWIINARRADLAIVYAKCVGHEAGQNIAAFLVDLHSNGVSRLPCDGPFPQHSIGSGKLILENVALNDAAMILRPGNAMPAILNELNGARAYVAAMCCAMLAAALKEAASYGQTRQTFGRPLVAHQGWRLVLARAATDLAAAEALTAQAINAVETETDAQLLAAQAKVHAVNQCQRHLPRLLQAQGAHGLTHDQVSARHLAAVQAAALTDGASDILLERVAHLSGFGRKSSKITKGDTDARIPD